MEKITAIDLEKMSPKELIELRSKVEKALRTAELRERKEALEVAEKTAAEFGFSLSELSGDATKPVKTAKAKYQNSNNPSQTWTGRGRKPQWIHDAINAGTDITDLEI